MRYLLLLLTIFYFSCSDEKTAPQLTVAVEKIALFSAPGLTSTEIGSLQKGDKLQDLGAVSHFENVISFQNVAIRSPWIKVQTSNNKQGWVFAGALDVGGDIEPWMLQKRLDCYFGHAFATRLNALKAQYEDISDDAACAITYRTSAKMRDTMLFELRRRPEPDGRPTYYWLSDILPGWIQQQAFVGGPPNLFFDYKYWRKKAQKTSGKADDAFFDTCIMLFPQDSIESFFPVWKFQISELESASQLGTGIHLQVLNHIGKMLEASRLFEPEYVGFKDAIVEDIQNKNSRYWQSKELILKDLDELIAKPPACLSKEEHSALSPRRIMFETPDTFGILVNLRSGE